MGSEQSLGELEGDEGPVPRPPGPRDPLLVLYGAEGLGGACSGEESWEPSAPG